MNTPQESRLVCEVCGKTIRDEYVSGPKGDYHGTCWNQIGNRQIQRKKKK